MNESGTPPTPPQEPEVPSEPAPPAQPPSQEPAPPAPTAQQAPPAQAPAEKKKGGWGKWVALGCGCGCLVIIAIVAVLLVLGRLGLQKVESTASDAKAVSTLRNGVVAAAQYYTDKSGSYEGLDATELSGIDSSTKYDDGPPSPDMIEGVVYIDKSSVTSDGYVMSVKSQSGKLVRVTVKGTSAEFEVSEDGVGWTKPEWPKP